MYINKVKINGFSSFNNFELNNMSNRENIIVGTNGTGKTNFMDLIATTLSSNYQYLLHDMHEKRRDMYVKIEIQLDDPNILLFSELFLLHVVTRLSFPNSHSYTSANLSEYFKMLESLQLFQEPIKLECRYGDKNMLRTIKFNFCDNCHNVCGLFDIHNHYKECRINKIFEYISLISTYIPHTGAAITENIRNDKSLKNKYIVEMNEINNTVNPVHANRDTYINEYFVPLLHQNGILTNNDVYNFIQDWSECETDFDTKNMINVLIQSNIMNTIVNNFINGSVNYIPLNEYTHSCDIYDDLMEYETKIIDCNGILQGNSTRLMNQNKILNDFLDKVNPAEEMRKSLHDNEHINEIKNIFNKITGKNFEIMRDSEQNGIYSHHYVITSTDQNDSHKSYHKCSYGECELINFLSQYYSDSASVVIVDEICSHLSSQNKINFRNMFLKNVSEKQIILVTHDVEMIDTCSNLLHFRIDNNKTYYTQLRDNILHQDTNYYLSKIVEEHPSILFSSNCLFVEGYNDKRVFDAFCSVHQIYNYNIIPLRGKETKSWEVCEELNVPHKIIFDYDKIIDFLMSEDYDANKLLAINITAEQHSDFKRIKSEKYINHIIFIKILECDKMKFTKLSKASIKALFMTLDGLGYTNTIGQEIDLQNSDPNSEFSYNITYLEKVRKLIFTNKISMNDLLDRYIQIFKTNSDEYFKKTEKTIKGMNTFGDRFKIAFSESVLDAATNEKVVAKFADDIIHKKFRNDKMYIWESKYTDLEGFMTKISGQPFNKQETKHISHTDITNHINNFKKKNDPLFKELIDFLVAK